jgi:hypothetical protein
LLDDRGSIATPAVARFAFETPCVEEALELVPEYEAPAAGGLYVARTQECRVAVIVAPFVRGLNDLGCIPHVDTQERSVDAIIRALELARLWGDARLPGDVLSAMRRQAVLQSLTQHILRILGGDVWADAEIGVRSGKGIGDLRRAVSRGREDGIGDALARDSARLASAERHECVEHFVTLWRRFLSGSSMSRQAVLGGATDVRQRQRGAEDPLWLSELALRLASQPAGVVAWAGPGLRAGVARLQEVPMLARAARFLVIATDQHLGSRPSMGELYAGWKWP